MTKCHGHDEIVAVLAWFHKNIIICCLRVLGDIYGVHGGIIYNHFIIIS